MGVQLTIYEAIQEDSKMYMLTAPDQFSSIVLRHLPEAVNLCCCISKEALPRPDNDNKDRGSESSSFPPSSNIEAASKTGNKSLK